MAAPLLFLPGKYPPAKPGALECWPLKAANGVADAAPGQAATEVASKRQRLNCTNIGQLFLVPDIGPYDLFWDWPILVDSLRAWLFTFPSRYFGNAPVRKRWV